MDTGAKEGKRSKSLLTKKGMWAAERTEANGNVKNAALTVHPVRRKSRAGYDQRDEKDVSANSTSSRDADAIGKMEATWKGKATFYIIVNEVRDEREKDIIASIQMAQWDFNILLLFIIIGITNI